MLIKALCDYYDVLAKKGLVLPDGYSKIPIKYKIVLTPEGKLAGIIARKQRLRFKRMERRKKNRFRRA